MPRATERLTKGSSSEEIKAAISATISELVKGGMPQEQAVAVAMQEARKKSGEQLRKR